MATSLNGTTPQATYTSLLKLGDNSALSASLKVISDGAGNDTPMEISTTAVQFGGSTGMYWENTNLRLSIGTNDALGNKLRVAGSVRILNLLLGGGNNTISATGGGAVINVLPAGVGIATTAITPTAYLQVRGTGATSATTAFRVENSAGTASLTITDDSTTTAGNLLSVIRTTVPDQKIDINANFGTVAAGIRAGGNNKDFILSSINKDLYLSTNFSNAITQVQFAVKHNTGVLIKDDASTTMDASARLEVTSTTQGLLPPRMTTTQKNAIATPAAGLVVYDTTTNKLCCYNGTTWNDLF